MQDFREFLVDVLNDPSAYTPMLVSVGILLGIWMVLLLAGIRSLRCSSRAWRLLFATVAVIPSLLLFVADIPMTIEKNQSSWRMDISWFFLVPLLLGAIGLWTWWKAQCAAPQGGLATQLGHSGVTEGPPSVR